MRVLIATSTTQGDRPDDCCWTTDGELVSLPLLECSCPDCGCDRCFSGLDSHRATTTCVVAEAPLDPVDLRRAVVRSLASAGWLLDLDAPPDADPHPRAVAPDLDPDPVAVDGGGDEAPDDAGPDVARSWADLHRLADGPAPDSGLSALDRELVDDVIARIVEVAESFPPGTVLARADGGVLVRRAAPVAAGP